MMEKSAGVESDLDTREQSPDVLTLLREATRGTEYENRLFLVGGYVRDKLLARENQSGASQTASKGDIDLVLEGDAFALATFLWQRGVTDCRPYEYPAFGTAAVVMQGAQVEMVTARAETYRQGSRKPIVTPGTLQTDAERRDFTVNTLMENLHTGEILDLTGKGYTDLAAHVLRTPLDPSVTFADDPLRMLRACRFAAKLGFAIAPETYTALFDHANRCNAENGISFERIRDEFTKTLLTTDAPRGLNLFRETGLLNQFAPELVQMYAVTQNRFHLYDVWTHTMVALKNLPADANLTIRLAMLFHDIGKPETRSVDPETGDVHFYGHEIEGAKITRTVMNRLRFSNEEIQAVTTLVALHMRYGEYQAEVWTDASVRRLIRAVGAYRRDLFTIAEADALACGVGLPRIDLNGLSERMEQLEHVAQITKIVSPLDGKELIALLNLPRNAIVGKLKDALTDAVVAGELAPDDKAGAEQMARAFYATWTESAEGDR